MNRLTTLCLSSLLLFGVAEAQVLAFPGAQGFGAKVSGGRGGQVIKVTNLNASGAGSLQAALNVNAPRIIVFAVSGQIEAAQINVPYGNVTVAGQTAPGAGITIKGKLFGQYSFSVGNMIFRHIRVRPIYDNSPPDQFDAVQFSRNHHMIWDHVSVAFGVDETMDFYEAQDVTVQWSVIESSSQQGEDNGTHNFALINGPNGYRLSFLNNLVAHHDTRCPAIANGPAEMYGNVVYNCKRGFIHQNPATGPFNIIANTFRAGTSGGTNTKPYHFDDENASPGVASLKYWLQGNVLQFSTDCAGNNMDNPWGVCTASNLGRPVSTRATVIHNFTGLGDSWVLPTTGTAAANYTAVLARAGAFPRDVVTQRSVDETTARTGSFGSRVPADLMVGLTATSPPTDTDNDGMPDTWETRNGLNPNLGTDHSTVMASGYTAIEEYINALADALAPNPGTTVPIPNPPTNLVIQ